MNRTEKAVTALVLVVNLSIGFVLVARADYSALVDDTPAAETTAAALSPAASP